MSSRLESSFSSPRFAAHLLPPNEGIRPWRPWQLVWTVAWEVLALGRPLQKTNTCCSLPSKVNLDAWSGDKSATNNLEKFCISTFVTYVFFSMSCNSQAIRLIWNFKLICVFSRRYRQQSRGCPHVLAIPPLWDHQPPRLNPMGKGCYSQANLRTQHPNTTTQNTGIVFFWKCRRLES